MHCISNYQGKSFAASKPFPIINDNVYNKMGIQVTLLYTLKSPTPKKKKKKKKKLNIKRKKKICRGCSERHCRNLNIYIEKLTTLRVESEWETLCHETLLQTSREGRVFEKALSFTAWKGRRRFIIKWRQRRAIKVHDLECQ